MDITGENTEGQDGADARCTLMKIDFEGSRLWEVAGDIPDIKGVCAGKQGEENSAGQYDFLLSGDRKPIE